MKKLITTTISMLIFTFVPLVNFGTVTVSADHNANHVCNPGPYGIDDTCEDFGLVLDDEGKIKPEFIAISTGMFVVGLVLILNGAYLNKKITE